MSINEALALIRRHKFEDALPILAKEVRARPDDPYAAFYLAYAFLGAQDPQPAVTLLTDLLQHHPDFLDARGLLGLARIRTSDFAAATREYQEVLQRDPNSVAGLIGLGMIHFWKRELPLAEEYLDRALRRNPRARDALVFKADVKFAQGEVAAAANILDEAQRAPTPALPEVTDAQLLDRIERTQAALAVRQGHAAFPHFPGWVQATLAATILLAFLAGAGLPSAWVALSHYQKGKERLAALDYQGCAAEMSEAVSAIARAPKAWAYVAYCSLLDKDTSAALSAWYTARSFDSGITLDNPDDQRIFAEGIAQATRTKTQQR